MKTEVIYVFKNGSTHLEIAEHDSSKIRVISMLGGMGYLDKRDIMTGLAERVELPADIREWAPNVRAVWLKQRLNVMKSFLAGNPLRGASAKLAVQSSTINHLFEQTTERSGALADTIMMMEIQRNYHIVADRTQVGQKEKKIPKSRRVKQRVARSKYKKIGALLEKKNSQPKFKRKIQQYPEIPKYWPIIYDGSNLGFTLAASGANFKGKTFLDWYADEGQYIDCSPAEHYSLWIGTKDNLSLRAGSGKDQYYFRYTPFNKPLKLLPWNWPYSKISNSDEERLAITGEPRKLDRQCFLTWFDSVNTLPHCGGHSSSSSICSKCAALAYSSWWKGK